jgi:hypothetical protein
MSSSAIASAENRCGARTRNGGSCTQWPVKGTSRCKMHGAAGLGEGSGYAVAGPY